MSSDALAPSGEPVLAPGKPVSPVSMTLNPPTLTQTLPVPQTSPSPQQQHDPGQLSGVSEGQLSNSRQQVLTPAPVAQSLTQFSAFSVTSQLPFPHDEGAWLQGLSQAKQSNSFGAGQV